MLISINDESGLVYGNKTLRNSKQEKVLFVTTDNKLNFARHLENIVKNASTKFNTLTKVQKYTNTK